LFLHSTVNRPQIRKFVDAKRLSESPAATLSISHPNIAGDCINVDLAPLIEGHLPFRPEFGWPRSNARWPSGSKIDQIKATGIHEVATDPFYWKLSFVSCEKELLKEIDINKTCRKKLKNNEKVKGMLLITVFKMIENYHRRSDNVSMFLPYNVSN
jgi:hypothetical protein